jgi:hypothetical protein
LIFVGKMWADLVEWAPKHLLDACLPSASPEDIAIPHCLNTAEEAITSVGGARAWRRPRSR